MADQVERQTLHGAKNIMVQNQTYLQYTERAKSLNYQKWVLILAYLSHTNQGTQ